MLIEDFHLEYPSNYADFVKTLTWLRVYCSAELGSGKKDYANSFKLLKTSFEEICSTRFDAQEVKKYPHAPYARMVSLLQSIENLLSGDTFALQQIRQIATWLNELDKLEGSFRVVFLQRVQRNAYQDIYSSELYKCIADLAGAGKYDTAISEAFKRIDRLLQNMCSVESHRFYGEELINVAFSEKSGMFQLGTDPNEQRGLRNLYSGAYALFRNVSVHRSLFEGEGALLSADWNPEMLMVFISLLEEIAVRLFHKHLSPTVLTILQEGLPALAGGPGWHEEISGLGLSWSVFSRRTDSSKPALANLALRCQFTLHETSSGFEWRVQAPRDLYGVVKRLIEQLSVATSRPVSKDWYGEARFLPLVR